MGSYIYTENKPIKEIKKEDITVEEDEKMKEIMNKIDNLTNIINDKQKQIDEFKKNFKDLNDAVSNSFPLMKSRRKQ